MDSSTTSLMLHAADLIRGATTPAAFAGSFHALLRQELEAGNPELSPAEQDQLRSHYPTLMSPHRFAPALVTTIYCQRRAPAVAAILAQREPVVLDAGCGYGSESFLFAAAGGRVLAVDYSAEQVAIARKRQAFYERHLGVPLEIEFSAADLDVYTPTGRDLSLTWLASVLAAIQDQEGLLRRIHDATRDDGELMVTDMNLLNPLFLVKEWRRRQGLKAVSSEFASQASYLDMVRRRGRRGARYYRRDRQGHVDDVQFFRPGTLARLFRRSGFAPQPPTFSGFAPPFSIGIDPAISERSLARIPGLNRFGYFYLMRGCRTDLPRSRGEGRQ
ncbi:MAG: class I SAM-dependent methyltransferase [Acidobacteriota bacterium]